MPWCPNCKTEYREGITHCADCKAELVADYKDVLLKNATALLARVDVEHEMFTNKLHDFLEYSGISSVIVNEGDMFGIYVAPEDFKKARRCFKAFYSVETEKVMQRAEEAAFLKGEEYDDYFGDDEEDFEAFSSEYEDDIRSQVQQEVSGPSSQNAEGKSYVRATARFEDYRSSGYTFTVLGILGIGFALLNFFDVISLFGSTFSSSVLFIMFAIFLALGIFSFVKAGRLKEDAAHENELIENVKLWMQENITKDYISSLNVGAAYEDESKTAELLYLDCLDRLLDKALEAFPALNASLAEQLIEEFCSKNFD